MHHRAHTHQDEVKNAPDHEGFPRALNVAIVGVFVLSVRAWAIPSPDLVVNLFASTAQVLGLVSVVLGSWFFGRKRRSSRSTNSTAWRLAFFASSGLFVCAALGWLLFAMHQHDEKARRLQVNLERSSKEDGKTVGDVSLKELSYSDQLKRKDGIATADLEALRAKGRFPLVYDVREGEEYEVGHVAGVPHVRYPDLMKAPSEYLKRDQPTLLLCFNGNRSSEMCEELRQEEYDVYFLVGGYEKWIAEDRPLEMRNGHARKELRELPAYPNQDVLLDTADVMDLLDGQDLLFVDVRYPGEYEGLGHLPGAVNVPARKLTTPELDAALSALPKKPVVFPCYDKRSSFYAAILGLKLSRMGYDFRGRYMTPESFYVPGKDKPHVAAWKAHQEEKTLLSVAASPLEGLVRSSIAWFGSFVLALALLVIALRLLVLPLTLKAERDRLVQARLAPRMKELEVRCQGNPGAISRGTMAMLREARIRPVMNLLATVVQLVLFTLFFSVVGKLAKDSHDAFLWIPTVGAKDPLFVLPVIVGALLACMVLVTAEKITKKRVVLASVAGVGIGVLVTMISAGSNLYLVFNLLLLVTQTLLVQAWFTARDRRLEQDRARRVSGRVVALRDAHRSDGAGNKAVRLAELMQAGLPVPDGFVVTCAALEAWKRDGGWDATDRAAIEKAFARLASDRVAVRSSGLKEDGADKSYAGVFESILDVRREGLFDALDEVAQSLASQRARAYSGEAVELGGIVVQAMVGAEFAGVMFTEHPGSSGACAIELVSGLGEALVSGRADPIAVRLGRRSGRPLDDTRAAIDLVPLFELGRKVESLFGRPQDIEWAFANGRFHLLQARDITRLSSHGTSPHALRERERARLLALAGKLGPDEVLLGTSELSELLPRPTPFSLSWMDALWAQGGSADLACQELGIPYDVDADSAPFVVGAFGSTFVNRPEEARRLKRGPGSLSAFRLSRAADEIERAWRDDFLPQFLREARLREALDLTQLSFKELVDLYADTTRRILEDSYLHAERINVAADFYFKSAVRALEKNGLDPARELAHLPRTVVHEAMERLAEVGRGETDLSAFLKLFAHRAPQDYELSQPRFGENPKVARAMAQRAAPASPAASTKAGPESPAIKKRVLALSVDRACRWQALKEEAKHHALRDFAFLRSLLVEVGERLHVGDDVFLLTHDEIKLLADARFRNEAAPALITARAAERSACEDVGLSGELALFDLERLELDGTSKLGAKSDARALKGLRVSGQGDVTGRARVLRESEEIEAFQDGEILVARFTDPTWTTVFPRARGIVTEVGGWLSHAAIQAREYDITAVVGVSGAMRSLTTGDLLALRTNGDVERVAERRIEERIAIEATVTLGRDTEALQAKLNDVSLHGALLLVPGHSLELGEDVVLTCERVERSLEATVVRNGFPGTYGLRFQEDIRDVVSLLTHRSA